MKLLICTQVVDLEDPVLAFFHRWIEEFSKHYERVHVVCLKEGKHALPQKVHVHSLGKESSPSRLKYLTRFYRYIWSLGDDYDTVFVHMNPEYAVLGGLLWRARGVRVGLWFVHAKSSLRLRTAAFLANVVFSASARSFPFSLKKLVETGHGIDTDFFSPSPKDASKTLRVMHVGRIAPVKRIEVIMDAIIELTKRGVAVAFDQYGEALGRNMAYAASLREKATGFPGIRFCGPASAEALRDAYRMHDVHVNATQTGSFDKTVGESMACGVVTVVSNRAFDMPAECTFREGDSHSLADALERISRTDASARDALCAQLRARALEHFSLSALVPRIVKALS